MGRSTGTISSPDFRERVMSQVPDQTLWSWWRSNHSSPLTLDVLQWLARLPFLASDDLALLTGQPEPEVETVLRTLERGGHIEWVTPSSAGLDTSRLYVLTEPARRHVAGEAGGGCAFSGERRDILHRLPCLEATVALNAFAAGLVASQRRGVEAEVGDFLSLPVGRHSDAWWPPGVRAFGHLQSDAIAAPFFVVVDRAGAPNAHRSALVAGWYQFRESRQPWGRDGVPPILILCPGPTQADAWARGVLSSAGRRRVAPLDVLLAERSAFLDADAIWRRTDRGATGVLAQLLTWLPGPAPWAATGPVALPPPVRISHAFGKLIRSSDLPQVRFHDLRHTAATLMLSQNVHPKIISERLGHASVHITLDTYSHVLPHLQDEASAAMDQALQSRGDHPSTGNRSVRGRA